MQRSVGWILEQQHQRFDYTVSCHTDYSPTGLLCVKIILATKLETFQILCCDSSFIQTDFETCWQGVAVQISVELLTQQKKNLSAVDLEHHLLKGLNCTNSATAVTECEERLQTLQWLVKLRLQEEINKECLGHLSGHRHGATLYANGVARNLLKELWLAFS